MNISVNVSVNLSMTQFDSTVDVESCAYTCDTDYTFEENDIEYGTETVSAYTSFTEDGYEIIDREASVYRKRRLQDGQIIQFAYLSETDDGEVKLDYSFDPNDPEIEPHPFILDIDDQLEHFLAEHMGF